MLSNLMKENSYQIDYVNPTAIGMKNAFGIYLRGCLQNNQPYCLEAKRNLFLCLDYVHQEMDEKTLVAVYIDVCDLRNAGYQAFNGMMADLRAGFFTKVLFKSLEEILLNSFFYNKLVDLTEFINSIQLIDTNHNVFQASKICLPEILIGYEDMKN